MPKISELPAATTVSPTDMVPVTQGTVTRKVAVANLAAVGLNTQTGTAYTLVLSDAGQVVQRNNTAANTTTVPTNATVAFPIGTVIGIAQIGTGLSTITGASGVTLTWNVGTPGTGSKALDGQYAEATLTKVGTDTWRLTGALDG